MAFFWKIADPSGIGRELKGKDSPKEFASMPEPQGGALVQLRKLLETHGATDLTDGQLLARFAAQRDESAFAALMKRHGPRPRCP